MAHSPARCMQHRSETSVSGTPKRRWVSWRGPASVKLSVSVTPFPAVSACQAQVALPRSTRRSACLHRRREAPPSPAWKPSRQQFACNRVVSEYLGDHTAKQQAPVTSLGSLKTAPSATSRRHSTNVSEQAEKGQRIHDRGAEVSTTLCGHPVVCLTQPISCPEGLIDYCW